MTETFYVLECRAEGCDVEFYVNDIPIILRGPDKGRFYGGPVHQNLVDGSNVLKMVIKPGPTPSESVTGKDGVKTVFTPTAEKAWAKIRKYPRGATVGDASGRTLMEVEWPIQDDRKKRDDFRPQEYPLVVEETRDLGEMFGPWEWQRAPRVTLDDDTREAIDDLLRELHASLNDGDPEPFIELSAVRLIEGAHAYEEPPRKKANLIRRGTAEDSAKPWWGMEPLNSDDYDLRLCGEERMVECIAKDWKAILREHVNDEGGRSYYPLFVSKIGDEWQIVR